MAVLKENFSSLAQSQNPVTAQFFGFQKPCKNPSKRQAKNGCNKHFLQENSSFLGSCGAKAKCIAQFLSNQKSQETWG
jgi:hypothetical protein